MLRVELERSPSGIDKYLEEWRRHSLESAMREIAWLEDMIKTERKQSEHHNRQRRHPCCNCWRRKLRQLISSGR
ncbi:hypothetical protein FGO68_gene8019 [Halteria grandinella]|uniref:Uncharacterized protein n=1 Tax=Halteria grandinella TaxID=5974 RepID=A0A8J8N9T5_HALGN|nr:hypothetical protein FGO68_gene8019 [Halteria grandinella]